MRQSLIALALTTIVFSGSPAASQQKSVKVVGVLSTIPVARGIYFPDFTKGLAALGYIEGENLGFDTRSVVGHNEQLPALADALVAERVAALAPLSGLPTLLAAKGATTTIPIVFLMDGDPVRLGVVGSLRGPNGNLTGVALLQAETAMKQLELMNELLPGKLPLGMLVDPNAEASGFVASAHSASERLGRPVVIAQVKDPSEFARGFADLAEKHVVGVVVPGGAIFSNFQEPLADLAKRYALPTVFPNGNLRATGGLMSYGADIPAMFVQLGRMLGKVLNGTRPGDLPIEQAERITLRINLKTAKSLGLTIPPLMLARADEVIE